MSSVSRRSVVARLTDKGVSKTVTNHPQRFESGDERGQVVVVFALLIPVLLALSGFVIGIGNWYVHGKHLQTKADAGAFAGGDSWKFPCDSQIDAEIVAQGQLYAESNNPQVGGVPNSSIHSVLNGADWYDDDSNPFPTPFNSPPSNPLSSSGALCKALTLDVKVTEDNSFPLASLIPLFPDIKRRARVEVQQAEGVTGLLPIAVRVPKPVSAAAIFYDETPGQTYGNILDVKYLCDSPGLPGVPTGLGGWTTVDPFNTQGPGGISMCPDPTAWANVAVPDASGVVVALSFRPMCGAAGAKNPCFDITNPTTVNQMCDRTTPSGAGLAQCFYATGSGVSQSVQSGLQFIRGYTNSNPGPNQPPTVNSVWLSGASGTSCGAYFGAPVVNACTAILNADVLTGNASSSDIEVRYKLVYGDTTDNGTGSCGNNYQPACDLSPGWSTSVSFQPNWVRSAIAIRVRLKNTTVAGFPNCTNNNFSANCQWFFTSAGRSQNPPTTAQIFANPLQRNFMGDIDLSGPVKWLNLWADLGCDGWGLGDFGLGETGQAASVPTGATCFKLDMGLQGAISRDQDEYPIAFNVSTTSQHQLLDCDPTIPQGQIDDAIAQGCGPWYTAHDFIVNPLCPGQNTFFTLPQPSPWQGWDPKTCVKTRPTASGNQLQQGFNQRFFGQKVNPSCPADIAGYQKGRNYWNDANNVNDTITDPLTGLTYDTTYTELGPLGAHGNAIPKGDPRLVTLFFTAYDSFGSNGQFTFPIVGLGRFYITGYGRAGTPDDPCSGGDSSGIPGAGRLAPPDLNFGNNYYVWGHFVKDVLLTGSATPSGIACDPTSLSPCVPVLVD
jgi:hypothetical protein